MGRGGVSQTPWHPQGVLIAHLAEHRQGVNQLAVAANGLFFATASNDETVKVWDCRRLEKDVSFKSRLTYTSQGNAPGSSRACMGCRKEKRTKVCACHTLVSNRNGSLLRRQPGAWD